MILRNAPVLLTSLAYVWLGAVACDAPDTTGASSPLETGAARTTDKTPGSSGGSCGTDTGTGGASTSTTCETSVDATGAACKLCFDAAGIVIYDGCSGRGSGGTGGASTGTGGASTGAGGASTGAGGGSGQCGTITDPTTGVVCRICYNPDGSVAATDCAPVPPPGCLDPTTGKDACGSGGAGGATGDVGGSGGGTMSCTATTDAAGTVCHICVNADGTLLTKDCAPPPSPTPTVSCVAATDIDSGHLCKVCSDVSGKVLLVDCDGEAPPAAK